MIEAHRVRVESVPARQPESQDFQAAALRVLRHLQQTVGLESWFVGRRQGDDWLVLSAVGDVETTPVPWSQTLCARVHDGQAAWATPDIDAVPALAKTRDALGLPWRSFVTVPLEGDGGQLLGTLCGAGNSPAAASLADCRAELELLAELLSDLLSAELRLQREARSREAAETDAQTDALTGLGNRRRWDRRLAVEEDRCRRYAISAAVITVDVDGLKKVNDRWGHDAGDALLRQLADLMRRECRPGDVLARLGGDEFAVLLAETSAAQAEAVAERLHRVLETAHVPVSMGVAIRGGEGLNGTWRLADARMYAHKRARPRGEHTLPRSAVPAVDPRREGVIDELLSLARTHTGADIAFIGRFEGSDRIMRAIESQEPIPLGPGHTEGLETTYCQKIVLGELPPAIPDTSRNAVAAAMPITTALPIGAYLGVPIHLPDGRLYGTLCCLSHTPSPHFDAPAVRFLTSVAASVSRVLAVEETERAGRRQVLAAIDEVLRRGGVTMAYQPVVDLTSGDVRGVEALARFGDEGRSPTQWFADAASVERTAELELRAAATALREWNAWEGDLWLNLSASVVISPAVAGLLAAPDLSRMVLEISEHEEVDDYQLLRDVLAPYRARGLRLAVDDVGSGFSSLRHVLELLPDVIKLDISLVHGLPADATRRALVQALVAFAASAGADVVAEGIETEAEMTVLRAAGVGYAQGFHLGRPLAADQHQEWLQSLLLPRDAVGVSVS